MSTAARSSRFGPPALGLTITTETELNQLTKGLLDVYSNALAKAIDDGSPSDYIEELKIKLLCVAAESECTVESTVLSIPSRVSEQYSGQKTLVSEAMRIISEHDHTVPNHSAEWSNRILACAARMTADEIAELKIRCNPAVWAALVFSNIRKTPARSLNDLNVGKVKIVDWDLFPSMFVDKCTNCEKKHHDCQRQAAGIQKCRECALFQLSCPRPTRAGTGCTPFSGSPGKKRKREDEPITRLELDSLKADIEYLRRTLESSITAYNKLKTSLADALM